MSAANSDSNANAVKSAEFKLKCIETGVKVVGAIVVVGTLTIGWRDYVASRDDEIQRRIEERKRVLSDQEQELEQREQQFKLQLYEQQISLYKKWVGIASQITFSENLETEEAERHLKQFNEMFWGELAVLKDDTIVRAGDNFRFQVANVKNGTATRSELRRTLHHLGQACRKSLCCSVGLDLASHTEGGGKPYRCGELEEWEAKVEIKRGSADVPEGKGEYVDPKEDVAPVP